MIPQTSASCYPFVHTGAGAERAQLAADRARESAAAAAELIVRYNSDLAAASAASSAAAAVADSESAEAASPKTPLKLPTQPRPASREAQPLPPRTDRPAGRGRRSG